MLLETSPEALAKKESEHLKLWIQTEFFKDYRAKIEAEVQNYINQSVEKWRKHLFDNNNITVEKVDYLLDQLKNERLVSVLFKISL